MFNVVINNEQHDEYLTQKEKIKELEAQIKDLESLVDLYRQKAITASGMYHHEHIKNIVHEDQKEKFNLFYADYQQALSDKAALIKERDRLTNVVHKQGSDIINLRTKIYEADNDLKEQNEALIKECNEYKELYMKKIIECNELRFANDKVLNELESVKAKIKERVGAIVINPCRDVEEAYSPDSNTNVKIDNLYITNNYFSKEDENNE